MPSRASAHDSARPSCYGNFRTGIERGDVLLFPGLISDGPGVAGQKKCRHDLSTQPSVFRRRASLLPCRLSRMTPFRQGFLHAAHANRLSFIAYAACGAHFCAGRTKSAGSASDIGDSGSRLKSGGYGNRGLGGSNRGQTSAIHGSGSEYCWTSGNIVYMLPVCSQVLSRPRHHETQRQAPAEQDVASSRHSSRIAT